jgi:hypothetical protein
MGGLDAWAKYQAETGYHQASWMMFPVYGGGDFDFDFKYVAGWDNHTQNGQDYQRYGDQQDWDKEGELIGGLMDCGVARLSAWTQTRKAALWAAFRECSIEKRVVRGLRKVAP